MWRTSDNSIEAQCAKQSQYHTSLRRQRREEMMNKRRKIDETTPIEMTLNIQNFQQEMNNNQMNQINQINQFQMNDENQPIYQLFKQIGFDNQLISQFCQCISSSNPQIVESVTGIIRTMLNFLYKKNSDKFESAFFDVLIGNGTIRKLVELLSNEISEKALRDTLFILINVSNSESRHCSALINYNIHNQLIKYLSIPQYVDDTLWIYSNLTADCEKIRDVIFNTIGPMFFQIVEKARNLQSFSTIQKLTHLCSNFFRFNLNYPETIIEPLLNFLVEQTQSEDFEILSSVFNAFCSISETNELGLKYMHLMYPTLKKYLNSPNDEICIKSVLCFGELAGKQDNVIVFFVQQGLLVDFNRLIEHRDFNVIKAVCWALSNFSCCQLANVADMIIDAGILENVCFEAMTTIYEPMKFEASWLIVNTLSYVSDNKLGVIFKLEKFFELLSEMLVMNITPRTEYLKYLLSVIRRLLMFGEDIMTEEDDVNKVADGLFEYDSVVLIDRLSLPDFAPSEEIMNSAESIMKNFFATFGEDDDEDFYMNEY